MLNMFIQKAYADLTNIAPIDLKTPFNMHFNSLSAVIGSVIEILLMIAWIIAVVYLIMGGYQYITSGGNPDAATKARNTIVGSVIGLIVTFSAYLIVKFIFESLGK
jgi:hypothetical protein